jgi:two-component system, chemotaxis family, CheB/CheR fusion protein
VQGANNDQEFDELLLMVKETRGFDFTGYKRSTLTRRVRRRMDARGLGSLSEYRDYLELEPDEFTRLFDTLLLERTLAGEPARTEAVVEAINQRGRRVRMVLEFLLLRDGEGNRRGVIIVMNETAEQK